MSNYSNISQILDENADVAEAIRLSLLDVRVEVPSDSNQSIQLETPSEKDSEPTTSRCPVCLDVMEMACAGSDCPITHAVCSRCWVRLRLLMDDKACPICKGVSNHYLISKCHNGVVTSFNDLPDTWLERSQQGLIFDERLGAHFYKCQSHYEEIIQLISVRCVLCKTRFRSENELRKHLKTKHHKVFCNLCIEHRPKFLSEQKLFTEIQLKQHYEGMLTFETCGEVTAGHPKCDFCHDSFFDASALYGHMTSSHYMCFFCSTDHGRQRYFQEYNDFESHVRMSHYLCRICSRNRSNAAAGAMPGFATKHEYEEHMILEHGMEVGNLRNPVHHSSVSVVDPVEFDNRLQSRHNATSASGLTRAPSETELIDDVLFPSLGRNSESNNNNGADSHSIQTSGNDSNSCSDIRLSSPSIVESSTSLSVPSKDRTERKKNDKEKVSTPKKSGVPRSGDVSAMFDSLMNSPSISPSYRAKPRLSSVEKQIANRITLVGHILCDTEPSPDTNSNRERTIRIERILHCVRNVPDAAVCSIRGDLLTIPCYAKSLIDWAITDNEMMPVRGLGLPESQPQPQLKLKNIKMRIFSFVNDGSRKISELKPMESRLRKIVHNLSYYYVVGSRSYGMEPKRHVVLSKRKFSRLPVVSLSSALTQHRIQNKIQNYPQSPSQNRIKKVKETKAKLIMNEDSEDSKHSLSLETMNAKVESNTNTIPTVRVSCFPEDWFVCNFLEHCIKVLDISQNNFDAKVVRGTTIEDINSDIDACPFSPISLTADGLSVSLGFKSELEAWTVAEALEESFMKEPKAEAIFKTTATREKWALCVETIGFDANIHRLKSRRHLARTLSQLYVNENVTQVELKESTQVSEQISYQERDELSKNNPSEIKSRWYPPWDEELWTITSPRLCERAKEEQSRLEKEAAYSAQVAIEVRQMAEKRDKELHQKYMKLRPIENSFDNL
jgi:hypothetical protein